MKRSWRYPIPASTSRSTTEPASCTHTPWWAGQLGPGISLPALPTGTYYVKTSDDYFLGYVDKWYPNKPCWLYTLSDAAPVVLSTADVGSINFDMEWMNLYEQTDPHIYYTPAWTPY